MNKCRKKKNRKKITKFLPCQQILQNGFFIIGGFMVQYNFILSQSALKRTIFLNDLFMCHFFQSFRSPILQPFLRQFFFNFLYGNFQAIQIPIRIIRIVGINSQDGKISTWTPGSGRRCDRRIIVNVDSGISGFTT